MDIPLPEEDALSDDDDFDGYAADEAWYWPKRVLRSG